jgi:hypothetical protein
MGIHHKRLSAVRSRRIGSSQSGNSGNIRQLHIVLTSTIINCLPEKELPEDVYPEKTRSSQQLTSLQPFPDRDQPQLALFKDHTDLISSPTGLPWLMLLPMSSREESARELSGTLVDLLQFLDSLLRLCQMIHGVSLVEAPGQQLSWQDSCPKSHAMMI